MVRPKGLAPPTLEQQVIQCPRYYAIHAEQVSEPVHNHLWHNFVSPDLQWQRGGIRQIPRARQFNKASYPIIQTVDARGLHARYAASQINLAGAVLTEMLSATGTFANCPRNA